MQAWVMFLITFIVHGCLTINRSWRFKLHKFLQLWEAVRSPTWGAWSKTILSS